jgi:hypothetical protein
VASEETLGSGEKLRTYFDARVNTQLTFLPSSFFQKERECLDRTTKIVDYIEHHFAESATRFPPGVPVTREMFAEHVSGLQAGVPELVRRAIVGVEPNQ